MKRLVILDEEQFDSLEGDISEWVEITPYVASFLCKNWEKLTHSPEYPFVKKLEDIKEEFEKDLKS